SRAAGTGSTARLTEPLFPSLAAVTVAVPSVIALMTPDGETLAMVGALLRQVIARPVNVRPLPSVRVATACAESPMNNPDGAVIATTATGTSVTFTGIVAVLPSEVALTVVEPTFSARTMP